MSEPTKSKKPRIAPPPRNSTDPADYQRHALAKLLADPTKPVFIPNAPQEGIKQLRAPREMMKNVQGSSAGAGSGEFHVYKQSRRREYERLKIMDEEEEYANTTAETLARNLSYQTTAELKTSKNRAKREKQKANRKSGAGSKSKAEIDEDDSTAAGGVGGGGAGAGGGDKKRKLGGGGMVFKSAEEREEESESEEVGMKEVEKVEEVVERKEEEMVVAAVEAGILIRDDD